MSCVTGESALLSTKFTSRKIIIRKVTGRFVHQEESVDAFLQVKSLELGDMHILGDGRRKPKGCVRRRTNRCYTSLNIELLLTITFTGCYCFFKHNNLKATEWLVTVTNKVKNIVFAARK